MHEVRLRIEARNRAAGAVKMMHSATIEDAELEAIYKELREAAVIIHDLICARLRGGDAGAQPRKATP